MLSSVALFCQVTIFMTWGPHSLIGDCQGRQFFEMLKKCQNRQILKILKIVNTVKSCQHSLHFHSC